MRLRAHEAIIACPRIMQPAPKPVPCEADLLVAVRGCRIDGLWLDVLNASCGHALTDAEEGLVLDAACEELERRHSETQDR